MHFDLIEIKGLAVVIYRDDLNHPFISGNKKHKLAPNVQYALNQKYDTIISFGGPYSNHLHALAWACKDANLKSIGVVRGELSKKATPTLLDCQRWGMSLLPCRRLSYRAIQDYLNNNEAVDTQSSLEYLSSTLDIDLPSNSLIIPEGGSNVSAIKSLNNAYQKIFHTPECKKITHVICPTGTGATLAGLSLASPNHINIIGMQAVKEGQATLQRIKHWINKTSINKLSIIESHYGGFAKSPSLITDFVQSFEYEHGIPLDHVYNGKALCTLSAMIEHGAFKHDDRILYIHTGGLQGRGN